MNVKKFLPKSKNRKVIWKIVLGFLGIILALGISWYGINFLKNSLEDFFLWKIESSGKIATINVLSVPENLNPVRNWETEELIIGSKAAISVEIKNGIRKVLFSQNPHQKLPLASLTKLMTALVVLENYDLSQLVNVSARAISQPGSNGQLKTGDIFSVDELLKVMLIESANDAAYALAEIKGEKQFIDLMNLKVKQLMLENTYFGNVTGLDPVFSTSTPSTINYSNTEDLVKLSYYLLEKHPKIWEILLLDDIDLYTPDGRFHHTLKNTNKLLNGLDNIAGGKTGSTPRAGECLILILENPANNGFIINVVLGSNNRFEEMEKMINWIKSAYKWL